MSLAREINYAHATAPDLLEDFVIAQTPLLIRHVHFSDYAFKNRFGHVVGSVQSLTQEATHANPSMKSRDRAAFFAFFRAFGHARDRVREPVRIFHQSYSVPAARAAHRYRISSSTSAGFSTVRATSSRSRHR